ncbi:Trp biosynthesis-associated membrane protein [Actinoallomurus purpureus]|uniref:Trp biosynthesis-associated membrane protein n=1 Tax=Actinoallomurus purpureus TaxID=478114 RepID=UPI0020931C1C|nr:Trp biosynthesis-associated membrane protein [Actinoallomurus purpureus]MCO6005906.1 Trp biosynthesis-associated membrane protein [Actinoallomurus purpureus]
MTTRRELVAAALLGAAGAGLAAGFAGQTWATVTARSAGIDPMPALQAITGRALNGGLAALGLAGLAGIAALFATRGWARTSVGALLTAFGVLIAILSPAAVRRGHVISAAADKSNLLRLAGHVTVHVHGWWIVSLTGGVLLAAAGLLTVVRGRRWPGMSARYDRPGAAPRAGDDPASLWKSLDRGDDPTSEELQER